MALRTGRVEKIKSLWRGGRKGAAAAEIGTCEKLLDGWNENSGAHSMTEKESVIVLIVQRAKI